jgi:hypothetical protein
MTISVTIPTDGTATLVNYLADRKTFNATGPITQGALQLEFASSASGPWNPITTLTGAITDLVQTFSAAYIRARQSSDFVGSVSVTVTAEPANSTDFNITAVSGAGTYGEVRNAELSPIIQTEFSYGLDPRSQISFLFGSGTAEVEDALLKLSTTGVVGDTAFVRTRLTIPYRPGQGTVFRGTGKFSSPTYLLSQVVGLFGGAENGIFIGYNYLDSQTRFGVCRQYGGIREIQTLTLSAGASGAENATVTLDGTPYVVPITAGTAAFNAQEIAEYGSWPSTWSSIYALDDTVVFLAADVGDKTGSFSFSSTGTAAGSFAETQAGQAATEDWVYQDSFNLDQLDGNGPSGMTLDPTKGNVFEVQMQYLGFGGLVFRVANPLTSQFVPFHRYQFANNNEVTIFTNSVFTPGAAISDRGAGVAAVLGTASLGAFVDGRARTYGQPNGQSSAVVAALGSTPTPLVSIRNSPVRANKTNLRQILPRLASVSQTAGKVVVVEIILNGDLTAPLWTAHSSSPIAQIDTSATAIANGTSILRAGTNAPIDLEALDIDLQAGDVLTLVAFSSGSGTAPDVIGSMSWIDDL